MLKGNKFFSTSHKESRYCLASISRLNPSRKMVLGKNWKIFNFIQRLSRLSRDCFVTKSFSRKLQCVSWLILRLPNPWKTRVFSFYVANVTFFQNHFTSLAPPLSNPLQPKSHFLSKTHLFQDNLCIITSRYVFLTLFSSFLLRLCKF